MSRPRIAVFGTILVALVFAFVLALSPFTASATTTAEANLVFIHHSVGANWLNDGLCAGLNANGYHVADIYYGWTGGTGTVYGDRTDTSDWPTWFTSTVMALVYPEMDAMTAPNTLAPAPGENTIIMFKSCYPNSEVGSSSTDEKAIYNSLLAYFQNHPDKMFVLVTPPPMASISNPAVTRELCNWLTDRDNGWLKDLTTGNVFVFDLYNVLTHPDAHHAWVAGAEMHQVVAGADTLYSGYHTGGDDHPNYTGGAKAAAEFVPLLNAWYEEFQVASGLLPERYEQTDSRLTYLGMWDTGKSASASDGSWTSSDRRGAAVLASFTGTDVVLAFRTAPWYGKAKVTLDAGTGSEQVDTVDLYSASVGWKVTTLYSKTGLADAEHTLLIERTGDKNGSSSGTTISLDAIYLEGTLEQAAQRARYEEGRTDFKYTGAWETASDGKASSGAFLTCDAGDDSASVSFYGTNLAWMARTAPWYGKAKVSLDGGPLEVVDLYSSKVKYGQKVYDTGLLTEGPHTLYIYWIGDKNADSVGTRLSVDAFDMFGTPQAAGSAPPVACRYQENDPRIVYKGEWSSTSDKRASGGSYVSTPAQQAYYSAARFTFHGTELTLFFRTAPWYGWAGVTIEGGGEQTVDLYSDTAMYGQPLYTVSGLSDTDHTVTVKVTNQSSTSQGWGISLDAIETDGYLVEPEAPIRHEEDEGKFEYVGGWTNVANASASDGAYAFTDLNGDSVNITFEGTNLAWYARTAPWYGVASVQVDGGDDEEMETIDLYSSSVKYGQKVFDTGFLEYGVHTVSIYCADRIWMPNSGSGINIDAIDVVGTVLDAGPAELTYVLSDQDDPRITYLGDWVSAPNSSAWGGDYAYTDSAGAVALVEFTGTEMRLMGRRAPWYGKALVTLDGTETEVDLYKPYVMQDLLFEATGLSPGSHTMTIECLGESSAAPWGHGIALDHLYMFGYLHQAETATKIDDKDDAYCAYRNIPGSGWKRWDNSGYWAAYQDTYAYADQQTAKMTFTFDGTFASWVAATSPTRGQALVTLDPGQPGEKIWRIDLYSPTTEWKKSVYSTGIIPDGTHTIEIICLHSKNPASSWYTINVDEFMILPSAP